MSNQMNDLIQVIKVLNGADLKKVNQYVDTLDFQDNGSFTYSRT